MPQVPPGTWIAAGSLFEARNGSAVATLEDGRTLFTGGTGTLGAALILAQKPADEKIESCSLGSHHECNRVRHTQRVREAFISACMRDYKSEKEQSDCMADMPQHCDTADRYYDYDEQGAHEIPMNEKCTSACKRKDCSCEDGPTCHFAHTLQDHFPPKRGKRASGAVQFNGPHVRQQREYRAGRQRESGHNTRGKQ